MAVSTTGHFVSGALKQNNDNAALSNPPQDAQQVECQIEEAFRKGKNQGCTETIASQQEKVDCAAIALNTAVEEMARIRQEEIQRMETATVRLALAIAKKIIGKESEHGTLIGHVVKTALNKVADPRHLTLRLHPKDIDTVNAFQQELLMADDFDSVFKLEADESILRGGCIIETKLGDVDARLDQQIRILEELLTDQLPKHPTEG